MKLCFETQTGLSLREESAPEPGGAAPLRMGWGHYREAERGQRRRPPFSQRTEDYTTRHAALWEAARPATPRLGPSIGPNERASRERQADRCIEDIERRLRQYPNSKANREVWREDFLRALREMAKDCLGFPEAGLRLLFNRTALEATRQFIRDARAFDAKMSNESVFQALRNLWVIHSLQLLLESEIAFSRASFGYSMLYPWTDNYLDDPRIPHSSKVAFGEWLDRRLAGACFRAPDVHAAQVGRLVAMVEDCYPREDYEEVYLSLRAIHVAQMASLRQQQVGGVASEQNLLAITFQKGGTSVLTDAYLVRGWLSEAEADFMFGYGALLQLMDDLQDLRNDLANGHMTLFTRQAASGPLDEATSKLWSFLQTVLWSSSRFAAPQFDPLKTLIQENCKLLFLQAVARNRDFYSGDFADELETCSPFRFGFFKKREETLGGEYVRIAAFLRRKRQINSVLDTLD